MTRGMEAVRSPSFILRAIEGIFSIVAFATVADENGSKFDFVLFTGITALLICLVFMGFYYFGVSEKRSIAILILIIDVIWAVFWLCAAAVLSSEASNMGSNVKASTAFAWLTFFLWLISTFLSFRAFRDRGSPSTIPPPAVGMV